MKIIKIKHPEDRIFVTGCLHYDHKQPFVWQARGFESVEAYNAHIEKTIDEIPDGSILINLGDLALNTTPERTLALLTKIAAKFQKVYHIFGNHCNNTKQAIELDWKKSLEDTLGYEHPIKNIEFHEYLELSVNGKMCCLFHFPISIWNSAHHGSWNLCSHSHGSYPLSRPDNLEIKQLDCGIDTHSEKKFWKFSDIRIVMNKKGISQRDHHDQSTN